MDNRPPNIKHGKIFNYLLRSGEISYDHRISHEEHGLYNFNIQNDNFIFQLTSKCELYIPNINVFNDGSFSET